MTYFSLLYETGLKEEKIKENAKKQPFLNVSAEKKRKFELIGSKMIEITDSAENNEPQIPAFFKDLNLDQVIDKIVLEDKDSILAQTFYGLLPDEDEIIYRQDIFRDLENQKVFLALTEFQGCISRVNRFIDYSREANHPIQTAKYMLDAMNLYYECILHFLEETTGTVNSAALRRMHSLLQEYSDSSTFLEASEKSRSLKDRIESIHYHLTLLSDRILFHFGRNANDFSEKIKKVFSPNKKTDNEFTFFRQITLTDLELKIADILYKKERMLFMESSGFISNHSDFIDPLIMRIHRELKFYISCNTYINGIKSKQFSFCYPDIVKGRKVEIKGLYDLAMAHSAKTGSDIITNDLLIGEAFTGAWVTGANQGGKTTFARSLGQAVYFMLIGLPVPGLSAKLPLFRGIFTHFPAEENFVTNNGKLKEELLHIKDMLTFSAGRKNLFILNELFSSATTADAFDMSQLLVTKLAADNSVVICVTHIPRLAAVCREMLSLGTDTGNDETCRRTYRIIPKEAEPTAYAADIAGKYQLTFKQIKEELGNEL